MSYPITCRACGAHLKLPPGCTKKKARCPKCNARMNLTAALDASAYLPESVSTVSLLPPPVDPPPSKPGKPGATTPPAAPAATRTTPPLPAARPAAPAPKPTAGVAKPPTPAAKPAATVAQPPPLTRPPVKPAFEHEEDPLPYVDLNPASRRKAPEPRLVVDDSPAPKGPPPQPPPVAPPFRTQARITADSAKLFAGPCEVVLVAHGLFLESVPYRPFLYAPLGSKVDPTGRRSFAVTLPDGRAVVIEFLGRHAARIAEDAAAFLARERGMLDAREYRRNPKWLLWLALIFSLGLAVGPVVMSSSTALGLETGLLIGAGFAAAGLLVNGAVVLLTRLSVIGKVAVMTTVGVVATGVFLLAATAYLAGRKEAEQTNPGGNNNTGGGTNPGTPGTTPPVEPPPDPRRGLPTAVDLAHRDGFYRFEAGPDDVTAIGVTPDGAVMIVGYKNGATRVWRFDHVPGADPMETGPKADGPVTRIQFDATAAIAYLTCNGGTVAAYWNEPPEVPIKIPGEPFAAHTFPGGGERFAAYRPGALTLRYVPTEWLKGKKHDPKSKDAPKGFTVLAPKDEVQPADLKGQLAPPGQKPTFLTWHPTGKLLAGMPDGSIVTWGAVGPRSELVCRDHRSPVRAWAASPGTWDFATGDDKGFVGLWPDKATTPRSVFQGATAAITGMAFSPHARYLALADAESRVWVWDLNTQRSVLKVTRNAPVKALAFGPYEDLLLLSDGKGVELWNLPELAKQP